MAKINIIKNKNIAKVLFIFSINYNRYLSLRQVLIAWFTFYFKIKKNKQTR